MSRTAATARAATVSALLLVAACADSTDDETATTATTTTAATTTVATTPAGTDDDRPSTSTTTTSTTSTDTSTATDTATDETTLPDDTAGPDGSVVSDFAGAPWFLGQVPDRAIAADPSLTPIRLGMINQEDTPVGSYPELRAAVEAAVAWVNAELGGVGGHPIELETCIVPFDPDRSRTCALELVDAGVVAFVGGVNVVSEPAFEVYDEQGLVSIGGIPANLVELRSPNAFFFSGGDEGALAAFLAHAAEQGATSVGIAYGAEVESFEVAARDYGVAVGESLGIDVELLPFSLFAADYTPVMAEAAARDVDAVLVLAATSACVAVVEAAAGQPGTELYMTGACASEDAIEAAAAGGVDVVWNAEGPVDGEVVEAAVYQAVVDRYATEPAGAAGTVGFRGFMNLYGLLLDAGGDDVTSAELGDLARASVDRPSFWGHPFTCDGSQVPGLPALCAPQQILFTVDDDRQLVSVTDWIATDELFAAAGIAS